MWGSLNIQCMKSGEKIFRQMKQNSARVVHPTRRDFVKYHGKDSADFSCDEFLEIPLYFCPLVPFVILPISAPSKSSLTDKLYEIQKIFRNTLTCKGSCGIMTSPLRRVFLLCPKLAPQDGHGPSEREVHGSFTSVRLQIIFYGRCRYHG